MKRHLSVRSLLVFCSLVLLFSGVATVAEAQPYISVKCPFQLDGDAMDMYPTAGMDLSGDPDDNPDCLPGLSDWQGFKRNADDWAQFDEDESSEAASLGCPDGSDPGDVQSCGHVSGPDGDGHTGGNSALSIYGRDEDRQRSTDLGIAHLDNRFTGGTSLELDVCDWIVDFSSTPQKDDFANLLGAYYSANNTDTGLDELLFYGGASVIAPNGTAKILYWLLLNDLDLIPPMCPRRVTPVGDECTVDGSPFEPFAGRFMPAGFDPLTDTDPCGTTNSAGGRFELHAPGDRAFAIDYEGGGADVNIIFFEWQRPDPSLDGELFPLTVFGDENCQDPASSDAACATSNAEIGGDFKPKDRPRVTNSPDTYEYFSSLSGPNLPSPGDELLPDAVIPDPYFPDIVVRSWDFPGTTFFEGGFNFPANNVPLACFTSFLPVTVASASTTAAMKDLFFAKFELCNAEVTKECEVTDFDVGTQTLTTEISGDIDVGGALGLNVALSDDPAVDPFTIQIGGGGSFDVAPGEMFYVGPGDTATYEGTFDTGIGDCGLNGTPLDPGCTITSKVQPGTTSDGTITATTADEITMEAFLDAFDTVPQLIREDDADCYWDIPVNLDISKTCPEDGPNAPFLANDLTPTFTIYGGGTNTGHLPLSISDLSDTITTPSTIGIVAGSVTICYDNVSGTGLPCNQGGDVNIESGGNDLTLSASFDLGPGEKYAFQYQTEATSAAGSMATSQADTVTVTANTKGDLAFSSDFTRTSNQASCDVDVLPDITVTKNCTVINNSGASLSVNIDGGGGTGTSNVDLTGVTLSDVPAATFSEVKVDGSPLSSPFFPFGLDKGIGYTYKGSLDSPSFTTAGCTTLTGTYCKKYSSSDEITVTAYDATTASDQETDSKTANCSFELDPGIGVDKVCDDATAIIGNEKFSVFVKGGGAENGVTGHEEKLTSVTLTNNRPGNSSDTSITVNSGADTNGSFDLDIDESYTWNDSYDVTSITADCGGGDPAAGSACREVTAGTGIPSATWFTAVVKAADEISVSATTAISSQTIGDESPANNSAVCSDAVQARLQVTKDCETIGNTSINFWGTVTNDSAAAGAGAPLDINDITLAESLAPGVSPGDIQVDCDNNGSFESTGADECDLAVGDALDYRGSYTPTSAGSHTDRITATGEAALVEVEVSAWDEATCIIAGQGCTPGYWRNLEQHGDEWTIAGVFPGDDFDDTFGVNLFNPNITLEQAVNLGGGGLDKLARHCTAAYISANHPGVFGQTPAYVIGLVQDSQTNPGNLDANASECAALNDSLEPCPLN